MQRAISFARGLRFCFCLNVSTEVMQSSPDSEIPGAEILRFALNDTEQANEARASHTAVDPWLGVRRLASRKIRGPSASLGMTQKTE
jgi:hypothetical protein